MASALSHLTDNGLDAAPAHGEVVDEKKPEPSLASTGTFVEGSEGVTHEELSTLRHLPDTLPFAAFLVVVVEFAERWTYYGEFPSAPHIVPRRSRMPIVATVTVWGNYIRAKLPPGSTTGAVPASHRDDGVAGALGGGVQASFAIRNFNTFWVYVTPFLGGFVADCYLGRYKTILYFSLVCL